jgi:hypothetical protein
MVISNLPNILIQISGGVVLFAGLGFEPDADLVVDSNGAWQWRGLDPSWRIS